MMPVAATLAALLLIAAITAPPDAVPEEAASLLEPLRAMLLSTNITPQILATTVIPGFYALAMALWLIATPGEIQSHQVVDADSDRGLEIRLRDVEERLNQLESGIYAHGHRHGGEASALRSVIKGVRDMEDVFRLFEAIDRGEMKLAEPPQTTLQASISKPQTEAMAVKQATPIATPQAVSRNAELVFNILEAFAKGRAGGTAR